MSNDTYQQQQFWNLPKSWIKQETEKVKKQMQQQAEEIFSKTHDSLKLRNYGK